MVNSYGPQTVTSLKDAKDPYAKSMKKRHQNTEEEAATEEEAKTGVEERVSGLESKLLLLEPGKPVPRDVYERLQRLEERVRFLEGMSPEYFRSVEGDEAGARTSSLLEHVKREERSEAVATSLTGINSRIQELQSSLRVKKEEEEEK